MKTSKTWCQARDIFHDFVTQVHKQLISEMTCKARASIIETVGSNEDIFIFTGYDTK
jgi:hypothetical protein